MSGETNTAVPHSCGRFGLRSRWEQLDGQPPRELRGQIDTTKLIERENRIESRNADLQRPVLVVDTKAAAEASEEMSLVRKAIESSWHLKSALESRAAAEPNVGEKGGDPTAEQLRK